MLAITYFDCHIEVGRNAPDGAEQASDGEIPGEDHQNEGKERARGPLEVAKEVHYNGEDGDLNLNLVSCVHEGKIAECRRTDAKNMSTMI